MPCVEATQGAAAGMMRPRRRRWGMRPTRLEAVPSIMAGCTLTKWLRSLRDGCGAAGWYPKAPTGWLGCRHVSMQRLEVNQQSMHRCLPGG